MIRERQLEGIAIAKKKGVYKGRLPKLSKEQIEDIVKKVELGIPKSRIAREYNITRAMIYIYLKENKKAA